MAHTYASCLYHCTFSTKDRRNFISAELQKQLWPYMGGIARQNEMSAWSVGGTNNHAHLLLSIPPNLAVSKAMQLIKGGSSKWVHDSFPGHRVFEWQEGYGAFTIAISGVERTIAYIENQAAHHQTRTFEQEFLAFLKRHKIDYDERYIWK